MTIFTDGTINMPGCKCGQDCPMPCWQRIGTAPACEACNCAAFDAKPDPNDHADTLAGMSDIWPEIRNRLVSATGLMSDSCWLDLHDALADEAALEAKFRKGEAEHGRDWLEMSRDQIRAEITNEWRDLILYHAMILARFSDRDETAIEDTTPA